MNSIINLVDMSYIYIPYKEGTLNINNGDYIYKEDLIREFFQIPANEIIVTVLGVGYPDQDPEARPRKAVDEIATFVE